MVIKFISNKKGGSSKSIDYLLNEREAQGTARTLQGDPTITREIINNISRKQKVTMGVMSFEEQNISEDLKFKLMEELEQTMFPGMDKSEYNILWVEHTDKGRLELNFVVPKEHLPTQKALQPYYHKADLPRFEKLEKIMNIENNFSDPQHPSKKRTLQINSKEIYLSKDYIELDNTLHKLVADGQIQNRQQMIELLKENNIQITRTAKETLSIKLPDSKRARKFKGDIYNEQFTSPEQLKEFSIKAEQRAREYNNRDTQTELRELKQGLEEYNAIKYGKLREQYRTPLKSDKTQQVERAISSDIFISNNRDNSNNISKTDNITTRATNDNEHDRSTNREDSISRGHTEDKRTKLHNREPREVASTQRDAERGQRGEIHKSTSEQNISRSEVSIQMDNVKGEINDSIGNTALARIKAEREQQQRAYEEDRKARIELYNSIERISDELQEQYIESIRTVEERSVELREQYLSNNRRTQPAAANLQREYEQIVQESENDIQQAQRNESKLGRFTRLREFGNKLTNYIETARDYLKERYNKCIRAINECKYKLDGTTEQLDITYKKEDISFQDLRKTENIANKNIEYNQQQKSQERTQYRGLSR